MAYLRYGSSGCQGCHTKTAAHRSWRANLDDTESQAHLQCPWDAGAVQVWVCFYAFWIPPMFGPDKWMQTKIPCRFNSLHGICWRTVRPIRTEGKAALNLAKTAKKGYTYPSGADLIRCVGGLITCAGTGERQLPCTAVIFVFCLYYTTEQMFCQL